MKKNSIFVYSLFLILLILTTSCATVPVDTAEEQKEPITIGAVFPSTGGYAIGGEAGINGMLLAQDEINKLGGINGRELKIVLEDSQSDQTTAVTSMNKLITIDKLNIIYGGFTSVEASALAPAAQENKVILLSPTATTSTLNNAGDFVFKLREGNNDHTRKLTSIMKQKNYNNVALIYNNNEYCGDVVKFFRINAEKDNLNIIAEEIYDGDTNDARTELKKLGEASPDAALACGYYKDLGFVFKQAKELNIKNNFFSITTFENPAVFEIAGDAVEGVIYTVSPMDCDKSPKFCENYNTKFGKNPDYRAAYGYDGLMILTKAIEKAGTEDLEKVKAALLETDFTGATGRTVFDKDGNSQKDVVVKTVKNGEFVKYAE